MPSPQASRRNLAKVRCLREYDEGLIIKDLIWQWVFLPTLKKQFKSQAAFARRLGVSQQYVSKVAKWTLWRYFHSEIRETYWQSTTLEEFDRARQRRLDSCYAPEPPEQEADTSDFEQTETGPDLSEESESNEETFASPRREQFWPGEMHTVAEWEEIRKYGRRPRQTIRFRIPGCF
jgi:hypothetical protein